jgi:outer membrane protein
VVENTRNLHRAVNTDVEQVQARKQSIISNQSAVEATEIGYQVGTRNIVDVLDAQRQLYTSVRNYNNSRYDYILDNLRLKQAAGTLNPGTCRTWRGTSSRLQPGQGLPAAGSGQGGG